MVSDPIGDMFTRIRNALRIGAATITMPSSKLKAGIAEILLRQGYIEGYQVSEGPKPELTITLKYHGKRRQRRPAITHIARVSRPSRRVYAGKREIPWVLSGMGIAIVTTPQGLMTDGEARRRGLGGEVIGVVW
ncbi:MAG: 30S ribosomal protein S8 [Anaerolineae bacterium]|nr:30S ribosomal protein S8 [Anaerolineae bacterium]MDW8298240.1 30S ribosomal protein S8 [Anaerolineae bacterium]